ncbi:MAG: hypothetical protein MZV63_37080 [Marinilabiliales bacterium]|nr:hypothetical protein [Marinilabiliales bacterium]
MGAVKPRGRLKDASLQSTGIRDLSGHLQMTSGPTLSIRHGAEVKAEAWERGPILSRRTGSSCLSS